MGDLDAKVGRDKYQDIIGDFDLSSRNERRDLYAEFCQKRELLITNTWYELSSRRLYTWITPEDCSGRTIRNKIDYILINRRFRNFITRVTAYSGADILSYL